MQKFIATISLILTMTLVVMPTASARIEHLPDDLHPDYAPVIRIAGGNEADYGNYFLQLIAGGLLYLAGPTAILMIAFAGLRYVTAHGKPELLEAAKKTLEWAIIGLIVVMLSFAAVRLIITVLLQTNPSHQTVTSPAGGTPNAPTAPTAPNGSSTAPKGAGKTEA